MTMRKTSVRVSSSAKALGVKQKKVEMDFLSMRKLEKSLNKNLHVRIIWEKVKKEEMSELTMFRL